MISAHFSNIFDLIGLSFYEAKKEIKIAVAWFTNEMLYDALIDLLKTHKVSLIINEDIINCGPDSLDFTNFQQKGGKLYLHNHDVLMHNKFCIIDDEILITGSYNYTYKAEYANKENVLKVQENKKIIEEYINEFNRLAGIAPIAPPKRPRLTIKDDTLHQQGLIDYMANDLFYKAIETKNPLILNKARLLNPHDTSFMEKISSVEKTLFNSRNTHVKVTVPGAPDNKIPSKEIKSIKRQIVNTSLGIESRIDNVNGKFAIIIHKGLQIPFINQQIFVTIYDKQKSIVVKTYKGENTDVIYNSILGEITISDLPPLPAGKASITVTMSINDNGSLEVTVLSNQTGNTLKANYYGDFCKLV